MVFNSFIKFEVIFLPLSAFPSLPEYKQICTCEIYTGNTSFIRNLKKIRKKPMTLIFSHFGELPAAAAFSESSSPKAGLPCSEPTLSQAARQCLTRTRASGLEVRQQRGAGSQEPLLVQIPCLGNCLLWHKSKAGWTLQQEQGQHLGPGASLLLSSEVST